MAKLKIALLLVVIFGISLWTYYMSGVIIYGGRIKEFYQRPNKPECNQWHKNETFADHREDKRGSNIAIPSCTSAKAESEYSEYFIKNRVGTTIRLLEMKTNLKANKPIWLHIHGITSSWLHGLRYTGPAERFGMRLFIVELANHGMSQRIDGGSSWGCQEKWDIIAAINTIRRMYPDNEIVITATSMGTLVATEAALEDPHRFENVRGFAFESPIPDLKTLHDLLSERYAAFKYGFPSFNSLAFLSLWRSPIDFRTCFHLDRKVEKPLLVFLSETEFPSRYSKNKISQNLRFSKIETTILPKGSHSAYWNYNPGQFERTLRGFFDNILTKVH